jgi:hypothetical protein
MRPLLVKPIPVSVGYRHHPKDGPSLKVPTLLCLSQFLIVSAGIWIYKHIIFQIALAGTQFELLFSYLEIIVWKLIWRCKSTRCAHILVDRTSLNQALSNDSSVMRHAYFMIP